MLLFALILHVSTDNIILLKRYPCQSEGSVLQTLHCFRLKVHIYSNVVSYVPIPALTCPLTQRAMDRVKYLHVDYSLPTLQLLVDTGIGTTCQEIFVITFRQFILSLKYKLKRKTLIHIKSNSDNIKINSMLRSLRSITIGQCIIQSVRANGIGKIQGSVSASCHTSHAVGSILVLATLIHYQYYKWSS